MPRRRLLLALPALAVTAALVSGSAADASPPHGSPPGHDERVGAASGQAPAGDDQVGWRRLETATQPSGRDQSAAAYHPGIERVVLFGGHDYGSGLADTWVFDGETWTELDLGRAPDPRYQAPMVYDAARGELVMFGGRVPQGSQKLGDTWVFDGSEWHQRAPAVSPPAMGGAGLAYDPRHDEVVLFGGERADGTESDVGLGRCDVGPAAPRRLAVHALQPRHGLQPGAGCSRARRRH